MTRVIIRRPLSGWTQKQWSLYAGYAVARASWDVDVYRQRLYEMLEGPLEGERRWFKDSEVFDESEGADGTP